MTGDFSAPADNAVPPADSGPSDTTITVSRPKVAVVGAGGFVGTNRVPRLVAGGFYVHALLRDASGFHSRDNVEVHVTDVSDGEDVARAASPDAKEDLRGPRGFRNPGGGDAPLFQRLQAEAHRPRPSPRLSAARQRPQPTSPCHDAPLGEVSGRLGAPCEEPAARRLNRRNDLLELE